MSGDILPEPRERTKSMSMIDSLHLRGRGTSIRRSAEEVLGTSLPLPSLMEYFRRNSSISNSTSSGISSSEELNNVDEFENELAKFSRNQRKSSVKNIVIHVPQVPNSQPHTVTAPVGKPFSLFHLFKVPNQDNSQCFKTAPSVQQQPQNTAQPSHNVPSNQPSRNLSPKPAKISKRELNFSSPISF